MDHKKVAQRIADAIGYDNITSAAHCATRLRLVLKNYDTIDQQALDDDPDLKGTFQANGQYQIIVGPGEVNYVYDELIKLTGAPAVSTTQAKEEGAEQQSSNPIMQLVKLLSDIFVPLIPALVAGGLLLALNNVLTAEGLFGANSLPLVEQFPALTDIAGMINTFAAAPFTFLPILIGYSATKRFGGNPYLGAVIGMIMVMPTLVNGNDVALAIANNTMTYWNIFGLNVAQAGYQGQVLPVIGVAYILATLEKFFHKHLKDAVDFTFTPLLAVILTAFITFIVVGPVLRTVSDFLTNGLVWIINTTGALGLTVFGIFYSPIVLTGLHQSFPAIEVTLLADIAKTGGDFIFPIASVANVAQGAATLAIFFLTKSEKEKSLSSSSALSAMLGITEPAMFGVNLKHRYPFYIAMIGSGVGAIIIGLFGVRSAALGAAGLIGFISIIPKHIPMYLLALLVSMIVSFTGTYFYGKRKMAIISEGTTANSKKPVSTPQDIQHSDSVNTVSIAAPVSGEVIDLKHVKDDVFSSGMMGNGIAIRPSDNTLYSPVDGTVSAVYETKHAYGIVTESGIEILLHIGIDTVEMKGDGFTSAIKSGDKVHVGDILGTFDREKIKNAGYNNDVMLLITNTKSLASVTPKTDTHEVTHGDSIIEVKVN